MRYITASFLQTITKTEQAELEANDPYITRLPRRREPPLLQAQISMPHFLYKQSTADNQFHGHLAGRIPTIRVRSAKAIGTSLMMFSTEMQVDSTKSDLRGT